MARQTRNWVAIEQTDFTGANRRLTVTGEVETAASNEHPVLKEAVPQGINSKVLILVLDIETSGVGNPVLGWRPVAFTKPCSEGQYSEVTIRKDGHELTIRVDKVIS